MGLITLSLSSSLVGIQTCPNHKGEYQLTDAVRLENDEGRDVRYRVIDGIHIDVGTPHDPIRANEWHLKENGYADAPTMMLIVTILAYNEERSISDVIREIPTPSWGVDRVEVLVINDGSTDNTVESYGRTGMGHSISTNSSVNNSADYCRTESCRFRTACRYDAQCLQ